MISIHLARRGSLQQDTYCGFITDTTATGAHAHQQPYEIHSSENKPHIISCELCVDVSLDVTISSSCFDSSFTIFSAARAGMPEKSRLGSGRCVFMATALAGLPRKVVVASGSSWLPRYVFLERAGKHVTRELQKLQN
jgi:hypothetical protein